LSPLPDWKGNVLEDPPREAWLEEIPSSLSTAYFMDQPEEGKSVLFNEASYNSTDGRKGEQLPTDYHWKHVVVLLLLFP
jgi:hypothetical protein